MRRLAVALCIALVGLAGLVYAASAGRFALKGTVVEVVDGDTLQVRLVGGRLETVRLIGIDTPERGECFAAEATGAARRLALGKRVTLKGDPTQATRDRYRRLLAYVWLPGGRDLGFQLIAGGFGKVFVYDRPFQRLSAYRKAESTGRRLARSVWTCREAEAPPPTSKKCDPSYPDVCIPPYPPDLDCGDVPYTNFRVVGDDPHGFDGDGDGVGCEE